MLMNATVITALVRAASVSVATVAACAAVGAYAHRQGLLNAGAQKTLDQLIASVFLPCLVIGKVTPRMNITELVKVWPLIAICPIVVLYGLLTGALVSRLLSAKHPNAFPRYRGLIMVAVAFPNSFSVPLTLLLAVAKNPSMLGSDDSEALGTRISVLFLMSYAIWVFARWSIGYPILSGAISLSEWVSKVMNPPVKACLLATLIGVPWNALNLSSQLNNYGATDVLRPFQVALEYSGRCSVPLILFSLGARLDKAISAVKSARQSVISKTVVQAEDMSRPLLRGLLGSETVGKSGCVDRGVAEVVGLRVNDAEGGQAHLEGDQAENVKLPAAAYIAVLFLRQVAGPLFSVLIACGLLRDLCGVQDKVILMVAMLQGAGPPMINISVMAGLSGKAEMETSKLLLVTYGASIFTWTLSIALFLWMIG